jgi:hypothetical protein
MFRKILIAVAALSLLAVAPLAAQTYAVQNPTYIPTPRLSATLTATGASIFNTQNIGSVSLRTTGTHTGLAGTLQCTNDTTPASGSSWTTLEMYPVGGGAKVAAFGNTNGFWSANTAGCTGVRANVTGLSTGSVTVAFAGGPSNVSYVAPYATGDVCQNPAIPKSSAVINVGAATTTQIVGLAAGTTVSVCSFSATLAGTTPTVKFVTGTGTDCVTGPAALTGVYAPVTGSVISHGGGGTLFQSAAASEICATTVGTGSSFQGVLSYVQQ